MLAYCIFHVVYKPTVDHRGVGGSARTAACGRIIILPRECVRSGPLSVGRQPDRTSATASAAERVLLRGKRSSSGPPHHGEV